MAIDTRIIRRPFQTHALVALTFVVLACAATWPLGNLADWRLPDADDAYFNVWRLAWVAHQLPHDPLHLFDANVFHPTPGTLALSDAMLLVGLAGAPLFWSGVDPAGVHNLLLIASIAAASTAAYGLCWYLTGARAASMIGGLVFGLAPYRFAHISHMELQWTVWMPIAMWALHRMVGEGHARKGIHVGVALAAQALCSLYYGVFLALFLSAATVILLFQHGRRRWRSTVAGWCAAAVIVVAIAGPCVRPYAQARRLHGDRSTQEVAEYSATLRDYARTSEYNRLFGWREQGVAVEERSLLPGVVAGALACGAFWPPASSAARLYGLLLAFAVDASLGVNGVSFNVLRAVVPPVGSLRAPARFGVLALLSVAVLVALGLGRGTARMTPSRRAVVCALAAVACGVEYWSAPVPTRTPPSNSAALEWLASQPEDAVIVELPMPDPAGLWLYETTYQYRSIFHWRRLVNGYSGFAPDDYLRTLDAMRTFPDAVSMARLRALSVDLIVLHPQYLAHDQYAAWAARLMTDDAVSVVGELGTGLDKVVVFRLNDPRP